MIRTYSTAHRALEILLGIAALAIGVLALVFPAAVVVTLVVFFGIGLLVIGVLRLATAATFDLPGPARTSNAVIGILAIVVSLLILVFPGFATVSFVVLIGIGILIYGVGRIIVGGVASRLPSGLRGLVVAFGILVAFFGIVVIVFPVVGVLTYAFFVSLAMLLIGVDSIATGLVATHTH